MDEVMAAILELRSDTECAAFLDALFSSAELQQLPVRWQLLTSQMQRGISQRQLAVLAGVAPATAARAKKSYRLHADFLQILVKRIEARAPH
jgi:uncharacterized protein YerC